MKSLTKSLLAIALLGFAFSGASTAHETKFGADRHVQRGVQCTVCHGPDIKNPNFPEEATCVQCHDKAALAEKTKGLKGANPHAAPHNGDCILCHMQHEAPVNYCNQCHQFDFKVK